MSGNTNVSTLKVAWVRAIINKLDPITGKPRVNYSTETGEAYPPSHSVGFVVVDGMRYEAFIPSQLVADTELRPGCSMVVENLVAVGDPQTSYVSDGITVSNKYPKQMVDVGTEFLVSEPEGLSRTPLQIG